MLMICCILLYVCSVSSYHIKSVPQLLSDFLCLSDVKNQGLSCSFLKDYFAITFLFYLLHSSNMNIPKIKTETYSRSTPHPKKFSIKNSFESWVQAEMEIESQGLKLKRVKNKIYFSSNKVAKVHDGGLPKVANSLKAGNTGQKDIIHLPTKVFPALSPLPHLHGWYAQNICGLSINQHYQIISAVVLAYCCSHLHILLRGGNKYFSLLIFHSIPSKMKQALVDLQINGIWFCKWGLCR